MVGIYHLVILDDDSTFKGVFFVICKALHIKFDIFAKINHNGTLVEKNRVFINISITIVAEDRGTNGDFVTASIIAGDSWSSFPLDGTNILHSVPTIG